MKCSVGMKYRKYRDFMQLKRLLFRGIYELCMNERESRSNTKFYVNEGRYRPVSRNVREML